MFEMENRGSEMKPEVLLNLLDYLSAKLTEGGFQVVPQEEVRARLKDQQTKSYKECVDQSCQVELGRELAAQKTLTTKILRIGSNCQITAVMYDLKKAATETAATAGGPCDVERLIPAVDEISKKLCEPLKRAHLEADANLARFEQLRQKAENEKAELDRMKKAWDIVAKIANDESLPRKMRIQALDDFMGEFREQTAFVSEAKKIMGSLMQGNLAVRSDPPGAEILIGADSVGMAPITKPLDAGEYDVEARLAGHTPTRTRAKLASGERVEVVLKLEPVAKTVESAKVAETEAESEAPAKPMSTYTLVGHVTFWSGVGLVALGGAGLGLSMSAASDFKAGDIVARDTSQTWAGVMWAGFGLGGALLITGVVMWLLPEETQETGLSAAAAPTADGDGFTLTLGGRF